MSRWETIFGLCRSYRLDLDTAERTVRSFFARLAFERVQIGEREETLAIEAARRYGKGRHPAALNMGDCFAYACAKSAGAGLLYKGNDFALTDLRIIHRI